MYTLCMNTNPALIQPQFAIMVMCACLVATLNSTVQQRCASTVFGLIFAPLGPLCPL